jgi:hypothetical protein
MQNNQITEYFPIHNVFIMILIISANWMTPLYPCQFRALIESNIYIRHIFGFFTLMFLVMLMNSTDVNLFDTTKVCFLLYIFYILSLRTPLFIFLLILLLLIICYILNLKKKEMIVKMQLKDDETLKNINKITDITTITTCVLTFIGVMIYLGQKKLEYKKDFKYLTFFLGNTLCRKSSPKVNYINGLKHAFD